MLSARSVLKVETRKGLRKTTTYNGTISTNKVPRMQNWKFPSRRSRVRYRYKTGDVGELSTRSIVVCGFCTRLLCAAFVRLFCARDGFLTYNTVLGSLTKKLISWLSYYPTDVCTSNVQRFSANNCSSKLELVRPLREASIYNLTGANAFLRLYMGPGHR